jgi:hypothetical protein
MRSQHRSWCARPLHTPLLIWLGLAVCLSAALGQDEPIPSGQSNEANVDKPAHFQVWRTITLGSNKGVDAYRDALDIAKIKIGDSADEILGRPAFPYARTKTGVELAVLSAADLGVESDQASLAEVYQRARQAGLEVCPAEVGPQLRLDYRNQPLGEDIAMEPVVGDAAPEGVPAQGCGGLVGHGARAGACERVMTRDGTVGRPDATERSLPLHWDIDPVRVMRLGSRTPSGPAVHPDCVNRPDT